MGFGYFNNWEVCINEDFRSDYSDGEDPVRLKYSHNHHPLELPLLVKFYGIVGASDIYNFSNALNGSLTTRNGSKLEISEHEDSGLYRTMNLYLNAGFGIECYTTGKISRYVQQDVQQGFVWHFDPKGLDGYQAWVVIEAKQMSIGISTGIRFN